MIGIERLQKANFLYARAVSLDHMISFDRQTYFHHLNIDSIWATCFEDHYMNDQLRSLRVANIANNNFILQE